MLDSMGQARLREALNAGGPSTQKEKGPPVADGILTVTPDTAEALEWKSRRSAIDSAGTSSSYLEDDEGAPPVPRCSFAQFLQEPLPELKPALIFCRTSASWAVWKVHLED